MSVSVGLGARLARARLAARTLNSRSTIQYIMRSCNFDSEMIDPLNQREARSVGREAGVNRGSHELVHLTHLGAIVGIDEFAYIDVGRRWYA